MIQGDTRRNPHNGNGHANSSAEVTPPSVADMSSWSAVIQRHSRLLVAVIDVKSHHIQWASDRFRRLLGLSGDQPALGDAMLTRMPTEDQAALRERGRRHILNALLSQHYGLSEPVSRRWLHEPLIVSINPSASDRPRYVEMTVSSDNIQVTSLSAELQAMLHACWQEPPNQTAVMAQLHAADSPLRNLLQRIEIGTYEASGTILLEGMDVTERELSQRLTHLLLERESILLPHRFQQANTLMKRLFRATDSLILTAESNTAKLFVDLATDWTHVTYPVTDLQASPLFQAACRGEVLNLPYLNQQCRTPCEHLLRDRGAQSVIMLPLVIKSVRLQDAARLMGLVALSSEQPDAFDSIDEYQATSLVPALTVAMRYTVQERFTNIHESVRWRFEEEAERRSLGLSPEPITFREVYPLYGISDIRGSSSERNRAIQADLLAQFRLALGVVEAVCESQGHAFLQQFRIDLLEHIATLEQGVTVDAEVTLLRYLKENLEAHFPYFRRCGAAAEEAIAHYLDAQDPGQGCVYSTRAAYDRTIQHINQTLRDTWQHWQQTLQAVTRHYCDIEATDGIDHMIYAGQAIDAQFTPFHLRSLRYEQLRAVCDCARTAFRLKAQHETAMDITHLVLVQDSTVDITHDENTERLFDVRGTRDTRYEIVKKRIDKAVDAETRTRITQPGCLTVVYSTEEEWQEYQEYLRYLHREGWVSDEIESGAVEPLQGVTGLKFVRVRVLPAA